MRVQTRIDPIRRDIEAIIDEELSPEAQSRAYQAFAEGVLAETLKENREALGRITDHDTFVNGAPAASLKGVAPRDTIVFTFEIVSDLFRWIDDQLKRHSPVRSGRYAQSHDFYADGIESDALAPPENAAEYVFVNRQPYARKIERGLSKQAPDGVYEAVAVLAQSRFGNIAKVRFVYRETVAASGLSHLDRKARSKALRDSRNPAIVITVR